MDSLKEVCRIIQEPAGEMFLRGMRDLYHNREGDPLVPVLAESLGLCTGGQLTSLGYLVGNVAKEYCNWLDLGRQMPMPHPDADMVRGRDVVDLGCSFGRWLWHLGREAKSAVGLEMQTEYAQLGRALAQREGLVAPRIITGSIDDMDRHLAPQSADFVFSRLAFSYVKIVPALHAVIKILRPSGMFWLQAETLFHQRLSTANGLFSYFNTWICETTGRQLAIPHRGRMHSMHRFAYPRAAWWLKAMPRAGFRDVRIVAQAESSVTLTAHR